MKARNAKVGTRVQVKGVDYYNGRFGTIAVSQFNDLYEVRVDIDDFGMSGTGFMLDELRRVK